MISDNYVRIMVIYCPSNDYGISASNSQHSTFDLNNDNSVSKYKWIQENIANNYVMIFGNLQQYSHWFIYWSYHRHQMPASPFTFGEKYFKIKTWE